MILCCGEALIDMIPAPTARGQQGFVPHPGGAVFNTAIALGRLGVRTGLLTGLSTDIFGQQLTEALTTSHVDASLAIRSDRPTTLAFVRLVDGHASYSFYDEYSAGRMLTPDDMPVLPADVTIGPVFRGYQPGLRTGCGHLCRASGAGSGRARGHARSEYPPRFHSRCGPVSCPVGGHAGEGGYRQGV